jgi:hypothetical protein
MASPGDTLAARVDAFLRSATSTVHTSALPEAAALALRQFALTHAPRCLPLTSLASAAGSPVPLEVAGAAASSGIISMDDFVTLVAAAVLAQGGGSGDDRESVAALVLSLWGGGARPSLPSASASSAKSGAYQRDRTLRVFPVWSLWVGGLVGVASAWYLRRALG